MRAKGQLEGVTETDLAEMRGQSTYIVEKAYRGMKAEQRKTSTQMRLRQLMEEEGGHENAAAGRSYLPQGEVPPAPGAADDAGCSTWLDAGYTSPDDQPVSKRRAVGKTPKTSRTCWSAEELRILERFAVNPAYRWLDLQTFLEEHLPSEALEVHG